MALGASRHCFIRTSEKRWIVYVVLSITFIQTYFVAFLWGMLLADLLKHKWVQSKITAVLVLLMGIYLGSAPYTALMGTMYEPIEVWTKIMNDWIQFNIDPRLLARTLGSAIILFALLRLKVLQYMFGWKPVAYLGQISFSLYLIHFTFLNTFSEFLFSKVIHHFSYNLAYAITFMVSMVPLFILSHYYMIYIDQNALKLARKVEKKDDRITKKRRVEIIYTTFFCGRLLTLMWNIPEIQYRDLKGNSKNKAHSRPSERRTSN